MSSPIENIKDQISRLEDLIRLYIDQEKEQQKQHVDFSLDKLSAIKKIEQQVLGGFAVAITILLGLTQLPIFKNNDPVSNSVIYYMILAIVVLIGVGCIFFYIFTRWHRNTAWTLGHLLRNYDTAIGNLQQILEYSIVGTRDEFTGERSVVFEVGLGLTVSSKTVRPVLFK